MSAQCALLTIADHMKGRSVVDVDSNTVESILES